MALQDHIGSSLNYCARCAAPLVQVASAGEQLLACSKPACARVAYRNAKPCAGVLVEHDGRLLLVQRRTAPYKGAWDISGGFLHEWEHPAECALREVLDRWRDAFARDPHPECEPNILAHVSRKVRAQIRVAK